MREIAEMFVPKSMYGTLPVRMFAHAHGPASRVTRGFGPAG